MLKIDIKKYIYDRVWFGYGRGAVYVQPQDWGTGHWQWQWIKL